MQIEGEYIPSALDWVSEQVAEYEASGGTRANTLRDSGIPIIVVTMRGRTSGKVRKIALMRVEHDGKYALVASYAGRPDNPVWYNNLLADPHVLIQDGPEPVPAWRRCVPELCRLSGPNGAHDSGPGGGASLIGLPGIVDQASLSTGHSQVCHSPIHTF
jgi:F420H(2)-dependent quinone reductase